MKFGLLFGLLWVILGNPFVAIIVLLVVLYVLDRSFLGFLPSVTAPFRRNRRLAKALQDIRERPFDVSAKQEAARLYMEKRRWADARKLLEDIAPQMEHSAEVHCDLGISLVKTGDLKRGKEEIAAAIAINPRVRYGEAHLRLAEALAPVDAEGAAAALQQAGEANSSSCELYYRLGKLYESLQRTADAKASYREALDVYRALPRYKRKTERRWAMLASARSAALR